MWLLCIVVFLIGLSWGVSIGRERERKLQVEHCKACKLLSQEIPPSDTPVVL